MDKKKLSRGFTLLELLVVVAIIGLLTSVVLISLTSARNKGADAGVKSNLVNAMSQAEVFYNTNTALPGTYTNVCAVGPVGGTSTIYALVTAAAKAAGLSSYTADTTGTLTTATCNDSASAWAAEVPLKSVANSMWCVDSTGKSKEESASIGAGVVCF
ncbi:MAG: type II secretion system protein [Minisyncoccia bacterium]